jgi:hypothetical protein
MRHSDPRLTMGIHARARDRRLGELTERVGKVVLGSGARAVSSGNKPAVSSPYSDDERPQNNAATPCLVGGCGAEDWWRRRNTFRIDSIGRSLFFRGFSMAGNPTSRFEWFSPSPTPGPRRGIESRTTGATRSHHRIIGRRAGMQAPREGSHWTKPPSTPSPARPSEKQTIDSQAWARLPIDRFHHPTQHQRKPNYPSYLRWDHCQSLCLAQDSLPTEDWKPATTNQKGKEYPQEPEGR